MKSDLCEAECNLLKKLPYKMYTYFSLLTLKFIIVSKRSLGFSGAIQWGLMLQISDTKSHPHLTHAWEGAGLVCRAAGT
jgi:hypothetical protein